jgi:hypothetical protein
LQEKLDICTYKTETRFMSFTNTSINSKWIKDLSIRPDNIRPNTLKLGKETAEKTLDHIGMGKTS